MPKRALLLALGLLLGCNDSPKQVPAPPPPPASNATSSEAAPVRPDVPKGQDVIVLAGGCYWGMEEILRGVDGVVDTEVGFAGGKSDTPSYDDVKQGSTGHAESVKVVFDPSRIGLAELLEKWFFRMHDPTTRDRQGNDVGTQYRSAIFYTSLDQKRVAEEVKAKVDESGHWKQPIVTEIVPATAFTPALEAHQDYLQKHPKGYTCHYMRDFGE